MCEWMRIEPPSPKIYCHIPIRQVDNTPISKLCWQKSFWKIFTNIFSWKCSINFSAVSWQWPTPKFFFKKKVISPTMFKISWIPLWCLRALIILAFCLNVHKMVCHYVNRNMRHLFKQKIFNKENCEIKIQFFGLNVGVFPHNKTKGTFLIIIKLWNYLWRP